MFNVRTLASILGACTAIGAPNLVRASDFQLHNDSDEAVYFSIADSNFNCPSGFQDHNWIQVLPGRTWFVDINSAGNFFIGAMSMDLSGEWHFVLPEKYTDTERNWEVPFPESSNGQCSVFTAADTSNPIRFPHALKDGLTCLRPGAQAYTGEGAVMIKPVCWDKDPVGPRPKPDAGPED
ncbi:MAG TPA: hypothetical protein VJV78_20620 [Polyangiales bacterium]|nr:hypothetical protein [Polyangiales bacterium]